MDGSGSRTRSQTRSLLPERLVTLAADRSCHRPVDCPGNGGVRRHTGSPAPPSWLPWPASHRLHKSRRRRLHPDRPRRATSRTRSHPAECRPYVGSRCRAGCLWSSSFAVRPVPVWQLHQSREGALLPEGLSGIWFS